ncbi:MAG: hypothetical protein MJY62_01340 [Bacteroidales bacterium]|nr:hypothetical protein [Bacteroidales bacterium]
MKKELFRIFAALLTLAGFSLSCAKEEPAGQKPSYGDNVTVLSSQKEVDGFAPSGRLDSLVVTGKEIVDVSGLSGTTGIGTLIITGTSITSIMCEISELSGNLEITGNPLLEAVGYMGLEKCGGNIILKENPLLWDIRELTKIKEFNGQYLFDDTGKFIFETKNYEVRSLADVHAIHLRKAASLTVCGKDVNDALWKELSDRLDVIEKDLTIYNTSITTTGKFFDGTTLGGNVTIRRNLSLTSPDGMSSVRHIPGNFTWEMNGPVDYSLFRKWYSDGVVSGHMMVLSDDGTLVNLSGKPQEHEELDFTITGGVVTEKVLRNYLSRATTESEFLATQSKNCDHFWGVEDDERKILNIGAKFIGRAGYQWNKEHFFNDDTWLAGWKTKIDRMHSKDPDIIFQAAVFEIVSTRVDQIAVPDWVFTAFGKTVQTRNFNYSKMCNPQGTNVNYWGTGASVPDMSQEEAQMWFYYMMVRYMETGIEAIHCGQMELMSSMGDAANGYAGYRRLFSLVREAARTRARRGFVLLDAHTSGIVVGGEHLLDFCSYPLRLKEVPMSDCLEATLAWQYRDSIVGRTKAGKSPMGWTVDRMPYLLEFDNFGKSDHPGTAAEDWFCWGYDEISWLSLLDDTYARYFLRYCVSWLKEYDPMGYVQMPGTRVCASGKVSPYKTNTQSAACTNGRNMEETIKDIWK